MNNAQITRKEYRRGTLRREGLNQDPFQQFTEWFETAQESHVGEANAMALATANANANPSVRMVLLKRFDHEGFVFATSYASRKGKDLSENPHAALLFFWEDLERQVRIEGIVKRTSESESDEIFQSRPRGSQVAAITSLQSQPVEGRSMLEEIYAINLQHPDAVRPYTWGGYRLWPTLFEFWQGGENRLHDRFQYRRTSEGWQIERLQP